MRQISSLLQGLARSLSVGRDSKGDGGAGAGEGKAAVLRTSGTVWGEGSETFAAVCSRRGEKGSNQDCSIVWEGFGSQEDTAFCGIFDGHGPWGHYVAKAVRESLPPSLLCHWQEALALASLIDVEKRLSDCRFDLWKQSYLAACAAVDDELRRSRRLDAVHSGCTALSIVKQGDLMVIANVGDSRAVVGTTSDDGGVAAVQLTVDFKPNLPQEKERIRRCNGRVHCLADEPGVHRVWLPNRESPGLAMSRAFGDYCVKDYGVISAPEVTQRRISSRDQFVILATDGVWDVISNEEAVQIVAATPDRERAAKRLVECAVRAWRRKRRGIAVDDCSAICLFLHSPPS
ncbi:probable protein phosphatase 2C 48 [Phragmites australis]|uniref:probable protein phosphatase 2C 48 n=1 Tax=Phragmites australis TaxID=29695 RepID=UPI002D76D030|nr:probable protein phosphatase 2C 48 [Phragmites australis]